MCPPLVAAKGLAIASGVLGAGKSIMGHIEGNAAARAQDRAYEQNRANALQSAKDETAAAGVRLERDMIAQTVRINRDAEEFRSAKSEAILSAAEAGIEGISANDVVRDLARDAEENAMIARVNAETTRLEFQDAGRGIAATATSRINSVQRGQRPSAFGLALGLAGAAVSTVGAVRNINAAKTAQPSSSKGGR